MRLSVYSGVAAGMLLGLLLMGGCKPVTRPPGGLLPTPTPEPIVALENPPALPAVGAIFPEPTLTASGLVAQPPTPAVEAAAPAPVLPQPTPTPEVITGPVTVGIAPEEPEECSAALVAVRKRTASPETEPPDPPRKSASEETEPSSTADAWAPRSSDSPVVSGGVLRRPRSRSIASMPSRAAAYPDGTPSRVANEVSEDTTSEVTPRR